MIRRVVPTAASAVRHTARRAAPRAMTTWLPTDKEQATGNDGEELQNRENGGLGYMRGALTSPFGTVDSPVLVPSENTHRVVGCTGGVEGTAAHHEVLWFELEKGKTFACPECMQAFKLVEPAEWEKVAAVEDEQ